MQQVRVPLAGITAVMDRLMGGEWAAVHGK
jgi:hypothetical protein